MTIRTLRFLLSLALLLSLLSTAPVAHAATSTVTTLADSGAGSLRAAIDAANANPGADTITFSVGGIITLTATLPAVTAEGGPLTIDGAGQTVTVSGNHAVQVLQVAAGASLTLNNLTIANGNSSSDGGGIANDGTLVILNSSLSGNSATGRGGGIFNRDGTVIVTNGTFSANSAGDSGGGILNTGTLTVTNSTFSGNAAAGGGGILNKATATLRNSIVANSVSGNNCDGTSIDAGNNIDDGTSCGWGTDNGSMSNTDPNLGALADNGGPTPTFALLPGSPAIDGVTVNAPNGAPSTDQRGVGRPEGAGYDIGSYESTGTAQSGPGYVVNSTADSSDAVCATAPAGDCTLREAIDAANAMAGANTITFSVSGTITLSSTLPTITAAGGLLSVDGTGQTVTISGGRAVRVLFLGTGAWMTLDKLTIANGFASSSTGGGIVSGGTLSIANSTFSGNSAASGGGIANYGTLTITNSTFSGNGADGAFGGGGIWNSNLPNAGSATIANSTFTGNFVLNGFGGGGIANDGALNIMNSTFSGNFISVSGSGVGGGGVYNHAGMVTIVNSTFSGNMGAQGGGIYDAAGGVTLRNTIVANNGGGNCGSSYGVIGNGGNNMDSDFSCAFGSVGPANGSMSNVDPNLGALANNGGATQTFALLPGSLAIDGVTYNAPNGAPSTDQRGVARPNGVRYDIGSFELDQSPFVTNVTSINANGMYKTGDAISVTVTFNKVVTVTGTPQLTLETGAADRTANYVSGAGTTTLTLAYVVQAGDASSDLDYVATTSLGLNGGTIKDLTLNNAVLTLASPGGVGSLGYNKAIVIDAIAPTTTIDTNPTNPSNDNTPTLAFSGNDGSGSGIASFMCRMDSGGYSACTTPFTSSVLLDGSHTFYVYALDNAGNADASPASYTWIIDTTAPNTMIDSSPSDPSKNSSPTFAFSGNDGTGSGIASFMCRMDSGGYGACTTPFTSSVLLDGSHTFFVYAIDNAGNADASPAFFAWRVDATPPTVYSSARADPNPTGAASVRFLVTFSEPVTGVDTADFNMTITGSIAYPSVTGVAGGPVVYTVTVNTGTGAGIATIRLNVVDNDTIVDAASNPLGGVGSGNGGFTTGEKYDLRRFRTYLPLAVRN